MTTLSYAEAKAAGHRAAQNRLIAEAARKFILAETVHDFTEYYAELRYLVEQEKGETEDTNGDR